MLLQKKKRAAVGLIYSLSHTHSLSFSFSFSFAFLALHLMDFPKGLKFNPETPFGTPLYPIFEQAYQAVVGKPASEFSYTPGVTPLSTGNEGTLLTRHHLASSNLLIYRPFSFSSHCDLHHLLCCHLWWPVPHEELACLQTSGSFPASQPAVDFCLGCLVGIDGGTARSHYLEPRFVLCHLRAGSMDPAFGTSLLPELSRQVLGAFGYCVFGCEEEETR